MISKYLYLLFLQLSFFTLFLAACTTQAILPVNDTQEERVLSDTLVAVAVNTSTDIRIRETSGLIEIDDHMWTNNDSGGGKVLIQLNDIGEVLKEVALDVPANVDWESLAADDAYFYVGDFGNNFGRRENLRIFKGLISDLLSKDLVPTQTISFSYEDQETLYAGYNHNFDAEALISYRNNLYVFSKNWLNKQCKVYKLPKTPGDYVAEKIDEFDTKGLITGADIREDQNEIVLIGYSHNVVTKEFFSLKYTIRDWQNDDFFGGTVKRFPLSIKRQTEAICYRSTGEIWISSENEGPGDSSIFRIVSE